MHWWLLRAQSKSEASYKEVVSGLTSQFEEGKKSLWEDHEKVSEILTGENANPQKVAPVVAPEKPPAVIPQEKNQQKEKTAADISKPVGMILVEIQAGEYEGSTYTLQPKARAYSWVGRSQGKKFREKGISLPKDLEVSTTHGRFELLKNKLVYVDTGSTNGSRVGEDEIKPNEPLVLESGMIITVGQTLMKITLP
jgi:hypothetical protein